MIPFLLAALAMRLSGISAASIWFDESMSILHIQNGIHLYSWDLLLAPFSHGPVWLMRFPSLAFSILGLWIAWKIMDRMNFSTGQRLVSCALLATLPGLIWLGQDARYYAALSACYMGALWFAMHNKRLGLFATLGLLGNIHPIGILLGASMVIIAMFYMPIKRLVIPALGILCAAPFMAIFVIYIQTNPGVWFESDVILSIGWAGFVNTIHPWIAGILMLMLVVYAAFKRRGIQLILAAVLPVLFLLFAVVCGQPILYYRPIMAILIPLCLLAGLSLYPDNTRWFRWIPLGLAGLVMAISIGNWDASNRGGHIDELAGLIRSNWQEGDEIVYATGTAALPFDYYLHQGGCIVEWGNNNLTPVAMDWPVCDLENDPGGRQWIIWPMDPLMETDPPGGFLVGSTIGGWQFARINVYLLDK
jgi:hypothetical protein